MEEFCDCKTTNECPFCEKDVCVDLAKYPYKSHECVHAKDCKRARSLNKKIQRGLGVTKEDIKEHQKRELKPRKKKEKKEKKEKEEKEEKDEKEEKESSSEVAKKIKEKRKRKDSTNSTSSVEECKKVSIFDDWEKHDPQKPTTETQKQIDVLKIIAVEREGCTCFTESEETLQELCYDDLEEAKKVIFNEVKVLDSKKGQQCSAYSILEKDGKYLILITDSSHSKSDDDITNENDIKMIRPAVEPDKKDFPFLHKGKTPVIYTFSSCKVCCEAQAEDSLIFDKEDLPEKKKDFIEPFRKKLEENELTDFAPEEDNQASLANKVFTIVKSFDPKCQLVFASKIQPNKTSAEEQYQQGWSLHHSEIECLVFAKRHGWNVEAIYIDRDCCPVCASTISNVDEDIYDAIQSFHSLKEELEPSEKEKPKKKKIKVDKKKEEKEESESDNENDGENDSDEEK